MLTCNDERAENSTTNCLLFSLRCHVPHFAFRVRREERVGRFTLLGTPVVSNLSSSFEFNLQGSRVSFNFYPASVYNYDKT